MTPDEFVAALFELPPDRLGDALPASLRAAADADPRLRAELEAFRRFEQALPQMGRLDVPQAFFDGQHARIVAGVAAAEAPSPAVWTAPAGSLVLFVGVVALYVGLGSEVGLAGAGSALRHLSSPGLADPAELFGLVYFALGGLALRSFYLDARFGAAQGARS